MTPKRKFEWYNSDVKLSTEANLYQGVSTFNLGRGTGFQYGTLYNRGNGSGVGSGNEDGSAVYWYPFALIQYWKEQ